jgi:hypothetical protein
VSLSISLLGCYAPWVGPSLHQASTNAVVPRHNSVFVERGQPSGQRPPPPLLPHVMPVPQLANARNVVGTRADEGRAEGRALGGELVFFQLAQCRARPCISCWALRSHLFFSGAMARPKLQMDATTVAAMTTHWKFGLFDWKYFNETLFKNEIWLLM